MATIQDVAKNANVSVATVSRVLNNSPLVSADTRISVMSAIEVLGYRPNMLGRNLRRTETHMILVLLPSIANPFYSRIVKGIEDTGIKSGYNVMLCNTDSDRERELVYLDLLQKRLADGVIFMAPELRKDELTSIGQNFPVVQCCEYKEGAFVSHVSIDNAKAAYEGVSCLIDLGHKKIALITCKNDFLSTIQRTRGYIKAHNDAGIPVYPELTVPGDYSFISGYKAADALLASKNRPTAIFAISDIMGIGAVRALKDSGCQVPDDISVMGFDDISYASMYNPSLSSVAQPKYNLGKTAMELLLSRLNGESGSPLDIFLEHKLIIRESVKKIV